MSEPAWARKPPVRKVLGAELRAEPQWSDVTLECGHATIGASGAAQVACWECLLPAEKTDEESAHRRTVESLRDFLTCAVPLWVWRFRDLNYTADDLVRIAHEAGDHLAHPGGGDVLEFGSRRKGEVAVAFNSLARGIAAAACVVPGGFDVFGGHWEASL